MPLSHDAQLILLGAAIALISSLITVFVQDWLSARRRNIEREEERNRIEVATKGNPNLSTMELKKGHLRNIYSKIGVGDRKEAVEIAKRLYGLLLADESEEESPPSSE